MKKEIWGPGNMLYPVPAVLVSCADRGGNRNLFTAAWTGTVCSDPAMLYVSVRPERWSYHMIEETGEFVVNLTTERLAYAADLAGVTSGRNTDKWALLHLTPEESEKVRAPRIAECPVNLECRVVRTIPLGSHTMFLAEVLAVLVDASLLDERGKLDLGRAHLIAYSHGEYRSLGSVLGTFGFSVRKKKTKGEKTRGGRRK